MAASGLELPSSSSIAYMPFDPASTEVVLDLGRSLYKLMFQLLLLIESNHKISSNVVNHFRINEDVSKTIHNRSVLVIYTYFYYRCKTYPISMHWYVML